MSENNNNNNQQKFNSVFAYWDTKDKRVQQSKVLQTHLRKPIAKPLNVIPTPPTSTTTTTAQPEQVVPASSVVPTVDENVNTTVVTTTQSVEEIKVEQVKENEVNDSQETPTIRTSSNGYDNVKHSPDINKYENVKPIRNSNDGSTLQEDLVVGETEPQHQKSQYDNFSGSSSLTTPAKPEAELSMDEQSAALIEEAEREHLEMSKVSASTYGSVYGGSVYSTYSYTYGATSDPYSLEDDDEAREEEQNRYDISEESLQHLELLCVENAVSDILSAVADESSNDQDSDNQLPQPLTPIAELGAVLASRVTSNNYQLLPNSNYYISGSTSGYSHPNVLTSTVATPGHQVDESLTSWNSEFQRILEMEDSLEKFERLASLEHDFVYAAESYGRIIISEHLLPDEQKTIKPVSVGGIAGGEKYLVCGILFKFAVESDTYGLYGSDENAMKTAAHELNGCTSFLNCGVKGLHVPLMAYIDYRGFRLMALSLLPITKKTLVYGSSDAGQTVFTANTMFNHKFASAAKILNLKSHRVQDNSGDLKTIQGPIDIEGHVGTDGRFYLLDFARLSPPEPPLHRGAYLYRLLRLELVRTFTTPLCSDAFSPMSTIAIENHNAEVREAYDFLMGTIIPHFAVSLDVKDVSVVKNLEFFKLFHAEGINMRHIGQVRQYCNNPTIREFLLLEGLVRCLKSLTRELLRREMKKTHLPSDYPYRKLMINFLNLIFGKGNLSETFWNQILRPKLEKKFKGILNISNGGSFETPVDYKKITYEKENNPFEQFLNKGYQRKTLLKRFTQSIGLVLSKQANSEFSSSDWITFVDPDIVEMRTQITRLNIIDYADGMSLYYKALQFKKENNARSRLLSISKSRLEQSLNSMSTNYGAIFQLGNVIKLMAKFEENRREDTYVLAENTYLSLEKLRIDQNLLYQSKLFRAKSMIARHLLTYDKKGLLQNCVSLLEETLTYTSNKCEAYYYLAKAKKFLFDANFPNHTEEELKGVIDVLDLILKEEPSNAKANLRMGEYLSQYSKFNLRTEEEISNFYNKGISEDMSLVNKIRPNIASTLWLFFPMTRTSPKIYEIVKEHIETLKVIRFPVAFKLLESDYSLFENCSSETKFLMKEGIEESIVNLMKILKYKLNNMNLLRTNFSDSSPVFTEFVKLTNMTSINLGYCKGIADYVIDTLATPQLRKLKFYNTEGITDTSIKSLALKSPNLEVLDAISCEGITGEHFELLVKSCPEIRKLGMPKKAGAVAVDTCLSQLKKLVSLDLLECEGIPQTLYNDAFNVSASIVKIRSSTGFPHFIIKPSQGITHTYTRHMSNEGLTTIPGYDGKAFARTTVTTNHFFHSRTINVFFNSSHPLVKFRDSKNDYGTFWIKVGQVSVVDKPIFKIAVHKLVYNTNLWDNDINVTVPAVGFGPTSTYSLNYFGKTHKFNHVNTPVHNQMAFTLFMNNESNVKIISASNTRTSKFSTLYDLFLPIQSHYYSLFLGLSQTDIKL